VVGDLLPVVLQRTGLVRVVPPIQGYGAFVQVARRPRAAVVAAAGTPARDECRRRNQRHESAVPAPHIHKALLELSLTRSAGGESYSPETRCQSVSITFAKRGREPSIIRCVEIPQRVKMSDVARTAGVSVATVSKVINGRWGVAQATVDRVQDVIERLGY